MRGQLGPIIHEESYYPESLLDRIVKSCQIGLFKWFSLTKEVSTRHGSGGEKLKAQSDLWKVSSSAVQ